MIFSHTFELIIANCKSQTRRIVKPDEQLISEGSETRVETPGRRIIYQVGKSYAVQPGRGKKSVARIILKSIRKETIGSISEEDSLAEGFTSRASFLETWHNIHGVKSNLQEYVWVLEFDLQQINLDELNKVYGQRKAKNRCTDNSNDLSSSLSRAYGTRLYSGHYSVK